MHGSGTDRQREGEILARAVQLQQSSKQAYFFLSWYLSAITSSSTSRSLVKISLRNSRNSDSEMNEPAAGSWRNCERCERCWSIGWLVGWLVRSSQRRLATYLWHRSGSRLQIERLGAVLLGGLGLLGEQLRTQLGERLLVALERVLLLGRQLALAVRAAGIRDVGREETHASSRSSRAGLDRALDEGAEHGGGAARESGGSEWRGRGDGGEEGGEEAQTRRTTRRRVTGFSALAGLGRFAVRAPALRGIEFSFVCASPPPLVVAASLSARSLAPTSPSRSLCLAPPCCCSC